MNNTELARGLRDIDLLKLSSGALASACKKFGVSDKGTGEELMERLYREIWRKKYD